MRYEDLTTEQTKALLDAIRDLPEGWRDLDNGDLLARLTGGETDPDPEPTPDPLVFEIPAAPNATGLYEHLIFTAVASSVSLYYTSPGPDSGDIYYFRDFYNGGRVRLDSPVHKMFDNAKSGLEAALASLPSVAQAEVTGEPGAWTLTITAESGHPLAAIDTAFDSNFQLNYMGA